MKGDKKFSLVLSGGGAKGAWEAGFLKYVAESWGHKFTTVCGTSIGSFIGLAYIAAASSENMAEKIVEPWNNVTFGKMMKISWGDIFSFRLHAFMDSTPLVEFLQDNIDTESYRKNIDTGIVETNIIATTELSEKKAHIWIDSSVDRNYESERWRVVKCSLGPKHVAASGAIPVAFRSVQLNNGWHVDGGLCNNTPILPAIMSMYKDRNVKYFDDPIAKILVLTLPEPETKQDMEHEPTILTQLSRTLESFTVNRIYQDVATATTINDFLDSMGTDQYGKYRRIELLIAKPSKSLDILAQDAQKDIACGLIPAPWLSSLSFLLAFQPYIQLLLNKGYEDAKRMHDQLEEFFNS